MKSIIKPLLLVLIGLVYACGHRSTLDQPVSDKHQVMGDTTPGIVNGDLIGKKDCCKKPERSVTSEITCPKCGHKKIEKLPTEVCQLFYKCEKCGLEMHPKDGDCCVFCSYGDHKCPSMQ